MALLCLGDGSGASPSPPRPGQPQHRQRQRRGGGDDDDDTDRAETAQQALRRGQHRRLRHCYGEPGYYVDHKVVSMLKGSTPMSFHPKLDNFPDVAAPAADEDRAEERPAAADDIGAATATVAESEVHHGQQLLQVNGTNRNPLVRAQASCQMPLPFPINACKGKRPTESGRCMSEIGGGG